MKQAWKTFWKVIKAVLVIFTNLAEAGEEYSRDILEDAQFSSEKSAHKREKKRAAWAAKNP
jgi:hypothetical protein